jgi:glycosyltransferase involved in cell wall biosynthesis
MKNKPDIKPKILFVGAFTKTLDGSVGGQLYACNTLVRSEISNYIDFTFIDSTMETLPPPSFFRRSYLALKRLIIFLYRLSSNRFDSTFIFTGSGFGFIEKGCMVLLSKLFNVHCVLSPRSGLLLDQINKINIMRWYVNFILKKSDLILCQSQIWSNFYQNLTKLPSQRFAIIKNWIDPLPYIEIPIHKKQSTQINVLMLGWVEKNKGIYDLLSIVKEHREQLLNYKFIICGKGSELKAINNLVVKNDLNSFFKFNGWVKGEDKINELKKADIFVLPSYREGLPNSLLEAMASGRAIIASSVGAIPDVIIDDVNGMLITPGNKKKLLESIIKLGASQPLREKIGNNARSTIIKQHDISNVWIDVMKLIVKNQ